jgi:radical SAM superfamily enzyme YgiQ (UPF0313 family)
LIDVVLADSTLMACGNNEYICQSAGAVFLALAQKGFDVRCVDLLSGPGHSSVPPKHDPADVCCYSVFLGNKKEAFRHMIDARRVKKAPRLIIAFGPFASVFPEEILSRGLADIVVTSDPEFVIPMVLSDGHGEGFLSAIPNLCYKDDGKIIHTNPHSFSNLDEIPFIGQYFYSRGHRPAFIMTSRGCPYHCIFCDRHVTTGRKFLNRSVANVLSEIKELVEVHHVGAINFLDADLVIDHQRLVRLCEGMRRIKGEFRWNCSACVDSVDQKLLLLMKSARCADVFFGVESASPQVLRRIGKTYTRRQIVNAVRWTQKAGMTPQVGIIVGNRGETDIDRHLTSSLLNELGPQIDLRITRLSILPGSALFNIGLREGWFTRDSYFESEGVIYYDEKKMACVQ